ncbi:MAG TPA: DUF805 domain-containing protein [Noviherbaspirillum sp.]|jgi:uncharacterized membrane protein YhaH (DUF805 family)|uniref:DUF805 domain-containing protein n=1 Tax=Noviherbaspirillum sp. TaxID=1926288 RepID=UPI002F934D64
MTFTESIKACFSNYANFNGRASRSEYWWFALFIVVASFVLGMVSDMLSMLFALGTLVPSLAAAARRLHDTDKSGWLQLIVLIPVLGWIAIIYFLAQPGTAGSNRFGNEPLNTEGAVTIG